MQVVKKSNLDIAAAAKELSQLEIEHVSQQKVTLAARRLKAVVRPLVVFPFCALFPFI